jgi:hypothetical protein
MSHQQHQQQEEAKSYAYLYYVIGLVAGLYTGYVIDRDFIWIPIGGVLGLLSAAFFANVVAKSSEKG